jgi:hypothetical protein
VFLTRIGDGVFGNDEKWIDRAINRAVKLYSHIPIEVIVVQKAGGASLEKLKEKLHRKTPPDQSEILEGKLEKVKHVMSKKDIEKFSPISS